MTPPPGSYDDGVSREDLGHKSARSFNSPASQGRASFWTSQTRQGLLENDSGDPGQYPHAADDFTTAVRSRRTHNWKNREGNAQFNARTPRGDGVNHVGSTQDLPGCGPQEHTYDHLFACGQPCTPLTSAFKSALPLGGHIRKMDTPGVGDYEPEECCVDKSFSKRGSSMFATDSIQHPLNESELFTQTTDEKIGPGTYEQLDRSIRKKVQDKLNPRLPPFASSAARSDPTSW